MGKETKRLDEVSNSEYDDAMTRKSKKLSDQIRQAIETCGKTRYLIGQDTGIDQATLSRFMNGKGGLSIPVLDRLGEYLGLNITMGSKPRAKKGR
jgi:transcriptional regulator with XRE-family HTH domain